MDIDKQLSDRDHRPKPAETPPNVKSTLAERGARYGEFALHATIAQMLQDIMRTPTGWGRLSFVQRQALTVIADKIARILNGDPNYRDNWHDIQGYAKLAEDRCEDTTNA